MTFLEKLKEEIPNKNSIWYLKQVEEFCPGEFGYEDTNPECDYDGCDIEMCEECWNREMPNTEKFIEPKCTFEVEVENAYNKGLNDAWELARKLYDMKCDEFEKIFGVGGCFYEVIRDFTPQEALAKLKDYEEAQNNIKRGDYVKASGELHHFYGIYLGEDGQGWVWILSKNDIAPQRISKSWKLEKVSEVFDLANILEQIGE